MAVKPDDLHIVSAALERIYAEGRLQGQSEAQQQFFGNAAAVLTASLFVAAMEQAASAIAPHSPESAAFFHEEAHRIQRFITPARVSTHDPADGATGVVIDTPIHVKFDGGVRPESLTADTFFVGAASGGPHLAATISYDPDTSTATLTPDNGLSNDVEYQVTIGEVRALGGMPLDPPVIFSFTTEG